MRGSRTWFGSSVHGLEAKQSCGRLQTTETGSSYPETAIKIKRMGKCPGVAPAGCSRRRSTFRLHWNENIPFAGSIRNWLDERFAALAGPIVKLLTVIAGPGPVSVTIEGVI
jgi:hypothetical protein